MCAVFGDGCSDCGHLRITWKLAIHGVFSRHSEGAELSRTDITAGFPRHVKTGAIGARGKACSCHGVMCLPPLLPCHSSSLRALFRKLSPLWASSLRSHRTASLCFSFVYCRFPGTFHRWYWIYFRIYCKWRLMYHNCYFYIVPCAPNASHPPHRILDHVSLLSATSES